MHPLFAKTDDLTGTIIASAIEVHRDNAPGLVESIYDWCCLRELELRQLSAIKESKLVDGVSRLILPGANL